MIKRYTNGNYTGAKEMKRAQFTVIQKLLKGGFLVDDLMHDAIEKTYGEE